jgi:hypothetical protein
LIRAVRAAGFEGVEVVAQHDTYRDVPNPSDAQEFGTRGVTFRAHKPIAAPDPP